MSFCSLAETEEDVFDLTEVVPETERLDSSLQKAKAQLSIKTRRHRPSRSRLRDSQSSTEGEDSLDGKSHSGLLSATSSPLHSLLHCPSPSSPASLSQRGRSFTIDPSHGTAESEKNEQRSALSLNSSSYQVHLRQGDLQRQGCLSDPPEGSPLHLHQRDHLHEKDHNHICQEDRNDLSKTKPVHLHPEDHVHSCHKDLKQLHEKNHSLLSQTNHSQSEDDTQDLGSDEPSSPTVLLDKKTRRRFLDLGEALRRTYVRVKKERANRHSTLNREPESSEARPSRTSSPPFVPFSWLTERLRGSSSPKSSSQSPAKSLSEDEEVKNDQTSRSESSHPYQNLSDHSDEGCDDPPGPRIGKKKPLLPFSSGARDRTERQNGIHRDKSGHNGDSQKLLTPGSRSEDY